MSWRRIGNATHRAVLAALLPLLPQIESAAAIGERRIGGWT
jgi:hypothetical protein